MLKKLAPLLTGVGYVSTQDVLRALSRDLTPGLEETRRTSWRRWWLTGAKPISNMAEGMGVSGKERSFLWSYSRQRRYEAWRNLLLAQHTQNLGSNRENAGDERVANSVTCDQLWALPVSVYRNNPMASTPGSHVLCIPLTTGSQDLGGSQSSVSFPSSIQGTLWGVRPCFSETTWVIPHCHL